jgi:asparagine synthase (glutamine-hydrolysing)
MNVGRFGAALGADSSAFASDLMSPALRELLPPPEEEHPLIRFPEEAVHWHRLQKLQYMDIKIRLPEFVNHSLDRSSMSSGVEARVPFLDHELAGLCSRIPVGLKLHHLREKHILREAVRGIVPDPIIARMKQGLGSPMNRWWRSELPEFARQALSEASLRATGYFGPASIHGLRERHRSGLGQYGSALNGVLAVQLRDNMFSLARLGR